MLIFNAGRVRQTSDVRRGDRDVAFYSGRFNLARLAASPYPCDLGDASSVSPPTRTPYDYERHGDRDNPEDDEY